VAARGKQLANGCADGKGQASDSTSAWAYVPAFVIITLLLLCSLYVLRSEAIMVGGKAGQMCRAMVFKVDISHISHE
jgi:hypothetical protein